MPAPPDSVMIFAAGLGTRMGSLTKDRPKPLLCVGAQTLLDHALAQAARIPKKVVNVCYHADQIIAHLSGRDDIRISDERPQRLETGGGLIRALPLLGGDCCFTLNTDCIWTGANPLDQLARAWAPDRMDALLLVVPRDRAKGHSGSGDFAISDDQRLTRGGSLIYTGAQIIRTDILKNYPQEPFSLNEIWNDIALRGRLCGTIFDGGWCDTGTPGGLAMARSVLAATDDV